MKLFVLGFAVICIYSHGSVYGSEASRGNRELSDAQLAPLDVETEASLPGSSDGSLARLSVESELEEEKNVRVSRNVSMEGRRKRPNVRYLPLSPSFGKSPYNRAVRGERSSFFEAIYETGHEPEVLSRQRREAHQGKVSKVAKVVHKVKQMVKKKKQAPAQQSLFSYDVDVAEPLNLPAQAPEQRPTHNEEEPGWEDATAFDIDWDAAQPPPRVNQPVNWNEVSSAIPQAMQQARQQFLRQIAGQGSNPMCPVDGPVHNGPGMIWAVSTHSPFSQFAYQREIAGRQLANQFAHGDTKSFMAAARGKGPSFVPEGECFEDRDVECDPYGPRTYDGTCVNPENPLYGSANTAQSRMASNSYEDGMGQPRETSVVSRMMNRPIPLPSSREVSLTMSQNKDIESTKVTYMFNQIAQTVAHDLVKSDVQRIPDPKDPSKSITPTCCNQDASCQPQDPCYPIMLPKDDRVFGEYGQTCMEFVRTQPAAISGCRMADRVPLNSVSHWLDASMVYGSKESVTNSIREHRRGMMRTNNASMMAGVVMAPGGPNALGCVAPDDERKCIACGDPRCLQHTGLVSVQSFYIRFHNYIATALYKQKPRASDEAIFQLARKIFIACWQHIIYNEMLPIILGEKIINTPKNGLKLKKSGYGEECDTEVTPSINTEFSTACFRFHTLSDNTLPVEDENGEEYPLTMHFLNPKMWYKKGMIDKLLRALAGKKSEGYDNNFSYIEQNQVFKPVNKPTGIDMYAFNMQRGKDHGVATYVDMRKTCGLSRPRSFKDLEKSMNKGDIKYLAKIYRHIEDLDLYPGALAENPVNGEGLVGPTCSCVIADQFKRLRQADCHFYDKEGQFPSDALKEIRKVTLASLMCTLSSGYEDAQPQLMRAESDDNQVASCEEIKSGTTMNMKVFGKMLR